MKREGINRRNLLKTLGAALLAGEIPHAETQEARLIREATGRFNEREAAARELERKGITSYQQNAYKVGISDSLARGFNPYSYGINNNGSLNAISDFSRAFSGALQGVFIDANEDWEKELLRRVEHARNESDRAVQTRTLYTFRARMDAWRLYLGISQRHSTFSISHFKPENSTEDKYYYRLINFLPLRSALSPQEIDGEIGDLRPIPSLLAHLQEGTSASLQDTQTGVMGRYSLSRGEDERGSYISYYDKWDLTGSIEGSGSVGQPYEIYDRIYFDPNTLEPLNPQPRS